MQPSHPAPESQGSPQGNPYAPPVSAGQSVLPDGTIVHYGDATTGVRFLNYFIDNIVYSLLGFGGVMLGMEIGAEAIAQWFGFAAIVGYYLALESVFGRTLGKFVTGTQVVRQADFRKPNFGQLLVRTVSRLVPFEPFSAFGGGQMWHDKWSSTRTVRLRPGFEGEIPEKPGELYDPY